MLHKLASEQQTLIRPVTNVPYVSLFLSFNPKMQRNHLLKEKINLTIANLVKQLAKSYSPDIVGVIIEKIKGIIEGLDYTTHKRSVVIFASPFVEKLFYLEDDLNNHFTTGSSFSVRHIVSENRGRYRHFVLQLQKEVGRIYLAEGMNLQLLVENQRSGENSNTFLQEANNALNILLNTYRLPVVMIGDPSTKQICKSLGRSAENITLELDKEVLALDTGHGIVAYDVSELEHIKRSYCLQQLSKAQKVAGGIQNVWQLASERRGKLLLIEQGFAYPAFIQNKTLQPLSDEFSPSYYIQDAVEDCIEKVLKEGGVVEFVNRGDLQEYKNIALLY